ncbi:glycosyltransferase involved in cell wall biosynthesis [Arcicella aurantiaca]|uniref:Glycosyltransferase involved in cell wall biosynthesis n=1 Tax=Arcicella aurantiaca TaxID=591202 RepID=A0A316EEH7_9BACT|nr:glycosyltransferase [Arcicella aurantiaca]PWK28977.1 glycosyltransferase involved in cell wall biosynthesis [Arcicella aurantiaca]
MKTLLLARPDHSINLYRHLSQETEVDVKFHTFGVFKEKSLLSAWKPYVKTVNSQADISYQFTAFHRLLYFLQKHFSFDYYKTENQISEYYFNRFIQKSIDDLDVLHYWPVYCYKAVETFKKLNPQVKLLADVYAAHPTYTQQLLEPEFEKSGIPFAKSHFYRSKEREIASLENAENIVVPSEYMAHIYRQYLPQANIFTASFGLQITPQTKKRKGHYRTFGERLKLIFTGKVSIEKGCIYLFEAMKQLPSDKFVLDVIGEIEPSQTSVFKQYRHIPNIRFLGKMPNSELLSILPSYHVFVMPSLSDAYSLAVSEALTSNIPVIVTENVGNKDDIRKYKVGEVCKAQCVESLLKSIISMCYEEYRQLLKSNIDNFIKEEETNNHASKVLNIYQTLISSK